MIPDINFVLQATAQAIRIWWEVLFPALLPFLILAEVWIGVGFVHFIGTLLDPIMRPLFRVPGSGGFVWVMGFASGYPIAAKLSAELVEKKQLTRIEAERLAAFATTADPMFISTAVAVGFLGHANLATLLLLSHFSAALLVGLLFRYYRSHEPATVPIQSTIPLFKRALKNMHQARLADPRHFGQILLEATEHAMQLVLVVGGFVVTFAILLALLPLHQSSHSYLGAALSALLEVTLGVKSLVSIGLPFATRDLLALLSAVIAWGGLSVHIQIAGIGSRARLRYFPFVLARIIHAGIAFGLVYVFWPWLGNA